MDPKLFGRYQISRKLAGGGMGRVFLAYDPVLNRQVGLKLIDAGGDRDSLDVIAAERRGATLQDQLAKREASGRVAQIFDVGEREGYFYIAMEYIEGEDLSELVARGPLPPDRAIAIALDILDVLVKAHHFQTVIEGRPHRGIIHGDIKPRNIRITSAGQVKVLDFGIAKAVSMTRSITFNQFGSIPYSSPERLQTGDMDARSDVWSVAIVLFEMLMGKPYFEAEASSKLEWMIRNYRVLQPTIGSLPAGLREILSRALDPDLNRRFASAAAFQSTLHEWQRFSTVDGASPSNDPDATRRTAYQTAEEYTRRAGPPDSPDPSAYTGRTTRPQSSLIKAGSIKSGLFKAGYLKPALKIAAGTAIALFLATVYTVVHEFRMWDNAVVLRRNLDSGQLGTDDGARAYRTLVKQSLFSLPLLPARNSLRDRYIAEADRVLADYREASASTPVSTQDWRRAQTALSAAMALVPEDKSVRGRHDLVGGYLSLLRRDPRTRAPAPDFKTARADFEEARQLLSHSPDPHLGLVHVYTAYGELDKAEQELKQAKHNGFTPGAREEKELADAYRRRGGKWMAAAGRAHDIAKMQEALRSADDDLAHAQELYHSIGPDGMVYAEKVSSDREKAASTLAAAQQAQQPSPEGAKANP